jgi:hypothetical protein
MDKVRITVPFGYSGTYVAPRKRNQSYALLSATVDMLLQPSPDQNAVPIVSCTTLEGNFEFFRVGHRIMRPLLGPDGQHVDPDALAGFLADPETDFEQWTDYPFPRKVSGSIPAQSVIAAQNKSRDPIISRSDPRKGSAREEIEFRDWIKDDQKERELDCHAAGERLTVVGGVVMVEDGLPTLEFDLKTKNVQFSVRTTRQSADEALLVPLRKTSYHSVIDSEIVKLPLADLPIMADILLAMGRIDGIGLRKQVRWIETPPTPGYDVDVLRDLGKRGLDRFYRDLEGTMSRDLGPQGLRMLADFMEAVVEHRAGKRSLGDICGSAMAFVGRRKLSFDTALVRDPEEFLLRLAIASENIQPEASSKADQAAIHNLEI